MIRKHIFIDNEQDRQVKEVASLLGVAEAEVIRRAITHYMNTICSYPTVNCNDEKTSEQMNQLLKFAIGNIKKQLRQQNEKENKK